MKYISIDIETTGLNPESCEILSFGAIIEDTNNLLPFDKIPKFYKVFKHKFIQGEPFALDMNANLIKEIKEGKSENLIEPWELVDCLWDFLGENEMLSQNPFEGHVKNTGKAIIPVRNIKSKEKLKVAGKNFSSFDKLFIENLPHFTDVFSFHQRVLDPASLFVDFKNDEWLPNLTLCKEKANLDVLEVSHNALEDAWDVIQVLRTKYK